jgi:hypothetical protein
MTEEHRNVQHVIVTPTKSVGIAILLTFLFGSIGMFYSTVWGAVIMIVLSIIVGILTAGLGLVLKWPISIIWGALAASSYNKKLLASAAQHA